MIKKLLTAGLLLSGLITVNAQDNGMHTAPLVKEKANEKFQKSNNYTQKNQAVATQTVDAFLEYFNDKHNLRASNPNQVTVFSSPSPSAVGFQEFGSAFLNPSNEPLVIYQVFVIGGVKTPTVAPTPTIPLIVTIYSASPSGVPGASVATATCAVSNPTAVAYSTVASFTASPVAMNSAFFIGVKAAPTNSLDTAWIAHARGYLPTATVSATDKFSDDLGKFKTAGNFGTINFTGNLRPECLVVPEVVYAYTPSTTASAPTATTPGAYCAHLGITYTATAGDLVTHKQYNFNAFAATWKPYNMNAGNYPIEDPVFSYTFAGVPTPSATFTTAIATHTYANQGTGNATLKVRCQDNATVTPKIEDTKTWTISVANCGLTGIGENAINSNLSVYPNPVINGKTNISGLEGVNTITVYNLLGQVISTEMTEKEIVSIDLSKQIPGTYVLRITDSSNRTRVVKVINQ